MWLRGLPLTLVAGFEVREGKNSSVLKVKPEPGRSVISAIVEVTVLILF